jgi:hypothetical protein
MDRAIAFGFSTHGLLVMMVDSGGIVGIGAAENRCHEGNVKTKWHQKTLEAEKLRLS